MELTHDILLELQKRTAEEKVLCKPIQYTTTDNFLDHFNIQKLSDLPTIDELRSWID